MVKRAKKRQTDQENNLQSVDSEEVNQIEVTEVIEVVQTDKRKDPKISQMHKSMINEYFNNGFNRVKAYLKVSPKATYGAAAAHFNTIAKRPEVKNYISKKQNELKELAQMKNENILKELITFAYSDITDYISLKPSQLRELPPDVRRCIESVNITKKKYKNRQGKDIEEENIKIKLVDKTKAIEMINKHIGFYLEDNKQRSTQINIAKLDINILNALLKAAE